MANKYTQKTFVPVALIPLLLMSCTESPPERNPAGAGSDMSLFAGAPPSDGAASAPGTDSTGALSTSDRGEPATDGIAPQLDSAAVKPDSAKLPPDMKVPKPDAPKTVPPPPSSHDAGLPPIKDQGVVASSVICGGSPPSNQTWVTGTTYYPVQETPRPGKCQVVNDPAFHTAITRITDKATDGYPDPSIENEYAKMDPENADGTLLVLRGENASYQLYELATFKRLKQLDIFVGNQEPEPRWDAVNPKVLYHLNSMKLMAFNTDTNQSSTVHDFSAEFPGGYTISTGVEGDASLDRRYWCFMVKNSSDNVTAVFSYDKTTNAVVGKKTTIDYDIDWLSTSMSGKHCVIGWSDHAAKAYPLDFSKTVALPDGTPGHADLALNAAGKDVLAYQNTSTDWIAMADLDTGAETNLVQIPFGTNTDIGLHFSGNCAKTPGWVLVATYGAKNPAAGDSHSWMDTSLFLVELKAAPRVVRVASTHAYIAINAGGSKNYFAEAYAAINRRGNRIYWGSNWGQTNLDAIETFVAELPDKWPTLVPP